ncbi:MAG: hypothetical protein K0A93_13015, partial [Desulfuromonadaceae bacterium]|nr:hypothetical protein [Desulfuromonadaceae bacterium]
LIVQEFVPAQAPPGASNLVTIQANFNYTNANPALTGSYTHQDLTIVSDVALLLTKEVRNVTRSEPWATMNTAKQGEVLEYRITYLNNGVHSINNLVVNDSTPAFTTLYELALCGSPLPSSLSSCEVSASPPVGSPGAIKWTFTGSLDGSAPGTVTYQVKVE